LNAVSERARLGLLCLLLLLMLGMLAISAVNTFQAVRSFQQQSSALETGDVSTIRDWMTIHAISHIYNVPEDYLERTLQFGGPDLLRHATLSVLANRKRQPVNQVIRTIQRAILAYRKKHPPSLSPTPTLHTHVTPLSLEPGRTYY